MKALLKKNLLIYFINRNGSIIIPSGQDCIKAGDTVMIVTTHHGFDEIEDILRWETGYEYINDPLYLG